MPDPLDDGAWIDFQHKLREHHDKRFLEFLRLSSEFSKLAISGLFAINTGGLLALTPIASLLDLSKLSISEKETLLVPSAALFVLGLLSGILCAFLTYGNYATHAFRTQVEAKMHEHVAEARRALLVQSSSMHSSAIEQIERLQPDFNIWTSKIDALNRYSQFAGWISFVLFLVGALLLLGQSVHLP